MERSFFKSFPPDQWIGDNHGGGSQSFELRYVRQIKQTDSYARQKEMGSQKLDRYLYNRRDLKYTDCLPHLNSNFTNLHSAIFRKFIEEHAKDSRVDSFHLISSF